MTRTGGDEVERVCFRAQLKPGAYEEYVERHANVWPEMLEALDAAGWHNYSIFAHPDGLVVGYVEVDKLSEALARMEATEVNRRWQSASAQLFSGQIEWLPRVFTLAEQLSESGTGK